LLAFFGWWSFLFNRAMFHCRLELLVKYLEVIININKISIIWIIIDITHTFSWLAPHSLIFDSLSFSFVFGYFRWRHLAS
jgi:hypothetical protein